MQIGPQAALENRATLTLQLWERSPPHSRISPELIPDIMKLGLILVFLVAIFKGDLWRTRDNECLSGHE
jgi:hypothetical protein